MTPELREALDNMVLCAVLVLVVCLTGLGFAATVTDRVPEGFGLVAAGFVGIGVTELHPKVNARRKDHP